MQGFNNTSATGGGSYSSTINDNYYSFPSAYETNFNITTSEDFQRLVNDINKPEPMTSTGLRFDQIPSVTGVPTRRQFFGPRKYLSPGNFRTKRNWQDTYKKYRKYSLRKKYGYKRSVRKHRTQKLRQIVSKGKVKRRIKRRRFVPGIESVIKNYLTQKGYPYCLPETVAVFSITGIPNDKDLIFDIHCCPTQDGAFVIEFRRTRGDAYIIAEIFGDLRKLLVSTYDEYESDDDESPVSGGMDVLPLASTQDLSFDHLIK